jgi:hypothetical protein
MLCSVTDCPAKEGAVKTHRVRLAAWQQQVIAKANFVEYERDRLLPRGLKNDHPIHAATDVPLKAARQAAGAGKRRTSPARVEDWQARQLARRRMDRRPD